MIRICAASGSDRARIVALLREGRLPTEDLGEEDIGHFFLARSDGEPVGAVGLELYGSVGLLRSLVVRPASHSGGIGSLLLAHVERHARGCGVQSLYLLTTTAEDFFAARGYRRAERSSAPATIRATGEFATLCPASAAFMTKRL